MFWNCMRRPLGEDFAAAWDDEPGARDGRPSVLFESPDGAEAHAAWKLLDRHGYRTMWCPGPGGGFSPQCTLSATGHCPLVDRADAVVSALDLRDPRCQEVARALNAGAGHHGRGRGPEGVGGTVVRRAAGVSRGRRSAQLEGPGRVAHGGPCGVQPSGRGGPHRLTGPMGWRGEEMGAGSGGLELRRRLGRERDAELGQRSLQAGPLAPGSAKRPGPVGRSSDRRAG